MCIFKNRLFFKFDPKIFTSNAGHFSQLDDCRHDSDEKLHGLNDELYSSDDKLQGLDN